MDEKLTESAVTDETSVNPAETTKTFTQEEFDQKLGKRVYKESKWFLDKLGIESKEEIDGILDKLKQLDKLKDYDDLVTQNKAKDDEINSLKAERTKSSYLRAIEKSNVDEEFIEFVYSKVQPKENEKIEEYKSRVEEYTSLHTNVLNSSLTTINTSVDLSGKSTSNEPETMLDAVKSKYKK
jgi:hypothetical protein